MKLKERDRIIREREREREKIIMVGRAQKLYRIRRLSNEAAALNTFGGIKEHHRLYYKEPVNEVFSWNFPYNAHSYIYEYVVLYFHY